MTKENILKIATDEFSLYGYDAVSMNKLAAKIQVNKATIYYHFKDKKALYQEVLRTILHLKDTKIEKVLTSSISAEEKFREYIRIFIQSVQEYPQIVPLTLRELANIGANIVDGIEEDINHELSYLIQIVSQLNLKEQYKEIDPHFIQSMIIGTLNTYYSFQISKITIDQKKNFDNNSKNILEYINTQISSILLNALCK